MTDRRLTVGDILSRQPRRAQVDVSEWWDGYVEIRELGAEQKLELAMPLMNEAGEVDLTRMTPDLYIRVAAWGMINADGTRMVSDEQVAALAQQKFEPIDKIVRAILEISGMTEEAVQAGKASLSAAPSSASSSG